MSRFVRLTDWLGRPIAVNPAHVVSVEETDVDGRCDLSLVESTGHTEELTVSGTLDEVLAVLNDEQGLKAHPNAIGWELTPEHPSNVHPSNRTPGPPAWAPKPRAMEGPG